ncbi:MAG: 16S rRNA (cytosine(1402)-N(4))-methyltransferase RsmH [Planctomycetota bacterium]|nr:MAG: 16S rRNA (cytosine(1402)-N(4))-methyltransferase RsmH [Planctomycetota bacterium]
MNRDKIEHEPVLCEPLMSTVGPKPGEIVVDATVGHGGHSSLMAQAIGETGRLIGLDVDVGNIERARQRLTETAVSFRGSHIDLIRANFIDLEQVLDSLGIETADVILADLGVSTDQLLDESLGLTFSQDAPLEMRLDDRLTTTATDLINSMSEKELAGLIYTNSQERYSRRIAKRICQVRREKRIRRTSELVRIVCSALGVSEQSYGGKIHPATRVFLAFRIAVNNELDNLKLLLEASAKRLSFGGRIAVISFHSGEDRLVKNDFRRRQKNGEYQILTKKPVGPTSDETSRNPRSRSAKLRVAMRR